MLDPKFIREHPEKVKASLKKRQISDEIIDEWLNKDKKFRELKTKLDSLRHERNIVSEEINKLNKAGKKDEVKKKVAQAKKIAEETKQAEEEIKTIEQILEKLYNSFPNLVNEKVTDKEKIIKTAGKTKSDKWKKDYLQICNKFKWLDFETAAEMTGSGFMILKDDAAHLLRAIANFCLDTAKKNGYQENYMPILLNKNSLFNTGHLPKFSDEMYNVQNEFYLSPTEEAGLINLFANKTLREDELPKYVTAYMPSFRTEKGATKGMIRMHQFDEVELVKVVKPDQSMKELDKMVEAAIQPLKLLGLTYRIKLLAGWDLSTQNSITYDIEVFSPRSGWLEVSSCSNSLDFQARRARIFYLEKGERKLAHTLNGTGLGLNRLVIAVLENCQQKDGTIKIPTVLQKYIGKKTIGEKSKKPKSKKKAK